MLDNLSCVVVVGGGGKSAACRILVGSTNACAQEIKSKCIDNLMIINCSCLACSVLLLLDWLGGEWIFADAVAILQLQVTKKHERMRRRPHIVGSICF